VSRHKPLETMKRAPRMATTWCNRFPQDTASR
jgi:hypothetical protein